jgi:hypothetical protein
MAMTLRLTDEQVEVLRRVAHAEHRSMQQVAQTAIEQYVSRAPAAVQRRRAVPANELLAAFADVPDIDAEQFRADQERHVDPYVRHDSYERAHGMDEDP